MVMETVLNSGIGKPLYSLEDLAEKYAGVFMDKSVRMAFVNYPNEKPFTESMLLYSALDVQVLEPIYQAQNELLLKSHQERIANEVENPLLPVVAKMEMDGIRLNVEEWLKVEAIAIETRERLNIELKETIVDFLLGLKVANGFELTRKAAIPVNTKRLTKQLEEITDTKDMRGWLLEYFNTKSSHQMKAVLNLMQGYE
jgi:hypothetical protein